MLDPSFWFNKRVMLTGHTGFKGSWLLLWLRELGAKITGYSLAADDGNCLFRQLIPVLEGHFEHIEADLADLCKLKAAVHRCQPQVVLHLAAQPLVRESYSKPLATWATNVMGTLHLLEALKGLEHPCAVMIVTTDKVYTNREWLYGYRETDRLGGYDPYSASKAAAELAVASWRASFCGVAAHQTDFLRIATARAGNVIGGGDWSRDRIVPDAMRALAKGDAITVRNPTATRPWQHVLEPIGGYLLLAEHLLSNSSPPCEAFNFGPSVESNRAVLELVETILEHWPGRWVGEHIPDAPHEAGLLHLQIDKARHQLGWCPRWSYHTTVARTVTWYKDVCQGSDPYSRCLADLEAYQAVFSE